MNKLHWARSLRTRLILLLFILSVLPLGLMLSLSIVRMRQDLMRQIIKTIRVQATTRAAEITLLFEQQFANLTSLIRSDILTRTLQAANTSYPGETNLAEQYRQTLEHAWRAGASDPLIESRVRGPLVAELYSFQQRFPTFEQLMLTDNQGFVVAATVLPAEINQSTQPWWQHISQAGGAGLYLQELVAPDAPNHVQGVSLVIPVLHPVTQLPMGALVGIYRFDAVDQRLALYNQPDQPQTLFVNGENRVISGSPAYPPGTSVQGQPQSAQADTTLLSDTAVLLAVAPLSAQELQLALEPLGWHVVVVQPEAAALQPITNHMLFLLAGGALILLLLLIGAYRIGVSITRPLVGLATTLRMQNLRTIVNDLHLEGNDEVSYLANTIHELAERVLAAQTAIEATNQQLEQQVADRTAELSQMIDQQTSLLESRTLLLEQIQTMAMPILPVTDHMIVVPIIGVLDAQRAVQLLDVILKEVERTHVAVVLLDVTGVPVFDPQSVQFVLAISTGCELLGAEMVVVGIRPEVAQTLVNTTANLPFTAKSSLQEGVLWAQGRVNSHWNKALLASSSRS